jgi:hypothetical protein
MYAILAEKAALAEDELPEVSFNTVPCLNP